jgi:hypothetical protein
LGVELAGTTIVEDRFRRHPNYHQENI